MGRTDDAERFFRQALFFLASNNATKQAGLRLEEMIGADAFSRRPKACMHPANILKLTIFHEALALSPDKKIRDESELCLAHCSFYMNSGQGKGLASNFVSGTRRAPCF